MNSHGAPKYFPFTEKEKKNYLKNGFGNKKKNNKKILYRKEALSLKSI